MIRFITSGLYIGDASAPSQHLNLLQAKLKTVLCLDSPSLKDWGLGFRVCALPGRADEPLSPSQIKTASDTIQAAVSQQKPILVQAQQSGGRAQMAILAYLIQHRRYDLAEAVVWLLQRSEFEHPPPEMLKALIDYYDLPYKTALGQQTVVYGSMRLVYQLIGETQMRLSRVQEGLYISGVTANRRLEKVQAEGIGAVLRVDTIGGAKLWPKHFAVLELPIRDGIPLQGEKLREGAAFIHQQRKRDLGVLVHCQMGISRSATMLLAYLIEYQGMSLAQAYQTVQRGRVIALPHVALMQSLVSTYGLPYTQTEVAEVGFLDNLLSSNGQSS